MERSIVKQPSIPELDDMSSMKITAKESTPRKSNSASIAKSEVTWQQNVFKANPLKSQRIPLSLSYGQGDQQLSFGNVEEQ